VRDEGIGIAPDLLSVIFEPFAQADRGSSRSAGGLGIGLSVVRQLVELHGGRVAAHSDGPGAGAEFVVRLPALSAALPGTGAEAPARAASAPRTRVLVVEDNPDAAATMVMLLEYLGHSVQVAHDGAGALELARAEAPELILVDIGLPDIDGYEVARRIRLEPALRSTRLVALTGWAGEEDRERASAAGFDRYLTKPVAVDALRELFEPEARVTPG
jgi:CheY-like chemotaxis protein